MKKYMKVSVILILAMIFAVGCGKNDETNEEEVENDVVVENNEPNENQANEEEAEEESDTTEQELTEGSVELSDTLDEIIDFYNTINVSDTAIIDQEAGYYQIEARKFLDEDFFEVSTSAYIADAQARLTLHVKSGEDQYEGQTGKTSGAMAEEVKEGVYEYADSLIWEDDGNSYQLKGGRRVTSSNEENNIEPAEDRLLFYESLTKTNNELDDMHEFLDRIVIPSTLPEGYDLSIVSVANNTKEVIGLTYPLEIIYVLKHEDEGLLNFAAYGDYEHAPELIGEGSEEQEIAGVTVQSKENQIMFPLGEETYRIKYEGIELDDVLEIAKSMIEQAN